MAWLRLAAVTALTLACWDALGQGGPRVQNGSFEADGPTYTGVGYVGAGNPIAGWTASNPIGAARNTAGRDFFDTGLTPDGRVVGVIQNPNSIRQVVSGFRAGRVYRISMAASGRALDGPDFGGLRVELNGTPLIREAHVPAVGPGMPFRRFSALFRTGAGDGALTIFQTNLRPGVSVLIDDIRIDQARELDGGPVIAVNPAAAVEGAFVGPDEDLTDRRWIWTNESQDPAVSAPTGARWFRREFRVPAGFRRGVLVMTADNECRARVNGLPAGYGDDFHRLYRMDVTALLRPGANVLTFQASNVGEAPNPAGLIAMLTVTDQRGAAFRLATDGGWRWSPAPAAGWDRPGGGGTTRPVRIAGAAGCMGWGWIGPPSRRVPAAFPEFLAHGADGPLELVREILARHLPGARPGATLWDAWHPMSSLWPDTGDGGDARARAAEWRRVLLSRTISDEGYVSTHQHRGYGHSEGWPIPLYLQTGGVGFHFSVAEDVFGSSVAKLESPDGWTTSDLSRRDVDLATGWRLAVTGPIPTVTTPVFSVPMAAAPFVRIEWRVAGTGASRAWVQWATSERPEFDSARRVVFSVPEDHGVNGPIVYSNVDLTRSPGWRAEGNLTRIRLGLEGATGGEVVLKSVITPADTRHNVNNPSYLQGCADYLAWTGDIAFLQQNVARMRRALNYMIVEFGLERSLCVDMPWFGHGGIAGFERLADGSRLSHYAVGVANNYWDLLPFGGKDALATVYCFDALRRMAELERSVSANPSWRIGPPISGRGGDDLSRLAERVRAAAGRLLWVADKGRFAASIDRMGVVHDYGYTFLNLEAIHYGFANTPQAKSILDWIEGRRIIAGETSTGADIYRWRFAPRTSTLRNEEWYSGMWEPRNVAWGDQIQDGGGVLGFSFHDLMARLRMRGADDAWRRLREITRWFAEVQAEGGYRRYYARPGRGNMQGGGPPGGLGMDEEFTESALLPQVMLYGFLGVRPGLGALAVDPRLPTGWPSLTVTRVRYHGLTLDISAGRQTICMTVRGGAPVGAIRIMAPAGEHWAGVECAAGGEERLARRSGAALLMPTGRGAMLILTREKRSQRRR